MPSDHRDFSQVVSTKYKCSETSGELSFLKECVCPGWPVPWRMKMGFALLIAGGISFIMFVLIKGFLIDLFGV